jgi:hypothetical protein
MPKLCKFQTTQLELVASYSMPLPAAQPHSSDSNVDIELAATIKELHEMTLSEQVLQPARVPARNTNQGQALRESEGAVSMLSQRTSQSATCKDGATCRS